MSVCSFVITCVRRIIRWCFTTCCCCLLKPVYVIDPENGNTTRTFRESFQLFVSYGIELISVSSIDECSENYPIAVLCRRQSDRAAEDIRSILDRLPGVQYYKRIAMIYIHVFSHNSQLPRVSTAKKTSEFDHLGIIVDFGFNPKNKVWNIYTVDDSRKDFENFVQDRILRRSSAVGNYNSMT